jgi:NAD(P)-dependent dehydrogenase (short-subunit alcohol dehydrogenase family)
MKNIIVTGAATGFGLLIAQTLAKAGHQVFATMRNVNTSNASAAQSLRNWAQQHNANIQIVELDVANVASSQKAIEQIAAATDGKLDVLINNAGLGFNGIHETLTDEQVNYIFEVNTLGPDRLIKTVLPYMHKQKDGLIINLTSVLARNHMPLSTAYNATKAALDALSVGYHYELKSSGIDVSVIQPGAFQTTEIITKAMQPGNAAAAANYGEDMTTLFNGLKAYFAPSAESPDPQEVADAVATVINTPKGKRPLWTVVTGEPLKTPVSTANEITKAMVEGSVGMISQLG